MLNRYGTTTLILLLASLWSVQSGCSSDPIDEPENPIDNSSTADNDDDSTDSDSADSLDAEGNDDEAVLSDDDDDQDDSLPPQNSAPIADAGEDQVAVAGYQVLLDGSNSYDPDGDLLSYQWKQISGTPIILQGTLTANPKFTVPDEVDAGLLRFRLTVSDGLASGSDEVQISVTKTGEPPLADAGSDQDVNAGDKVTLDGSASQFFGQGQATYQWQQTQGPTVALESDSFAQSTFIAPDIDEPSVELAFQLVVMQDSLSDSDEIFITVYFAGGDNPGNQGGSGGGGGAGGGGGSGGGDSGRGGEECAQNSQCDDGRYCNGAETCVGGSCQAGSFPCQSDETCNESTNQCEPDNGNDAPTASSASVTTFKNTPKMITLNGTDADGDDLTFSIVSGPLHGNLGLVNNSGRLTAQVLYTPQSGFTGVDSFTFKANDGQFDSNVATMTVAVQETPIGNTYYVSLTGSDSNPGTEAQPFKTIQKAANIVNPGDVVYIKAGRYTRPSGKDRVVELLRSGADGAPITFAAYGDGEVILDGELASNSIGFYINGRYASDGINYIVLRGLTAINNQSYGIFVRNSAYTLIEHCKAMYNRSKGIFIGAGGAGNGAGAYQTVQYCETAYNYGTGIGAGSNINGQSQPHHVTIQYNYSHSNKDPAYAGNTDGIGCGGMGNDYSVIRGNVAHDNSDDGFDLGMSAQFMLVEHNAVYNHQDPEGDGSGIKIGTHESFMKDAGGGFLVRYNVVFNNKLRNFDLAGNYRPGENREEPLILHNNTCLNAGFDTIFYEEGDLFLYNNIVWSGDNGAFWSVRMRGGSDNPPFVLSDYNLMQDRYVKDWDEVIRTDLDAHSVSANPEFIDINNIVVNTDLGSPNFGDVPALRLKSNSLAVDAGVEMRAQLLQLLNLAQQEGNQKWVNGINFGLSLTPNPMSFNGSAPDLGAYER